MVKQISNRISSRLVISFNGLPGTIGAGIKLDATYGQVSDGGGYKTAESARLCRPPPFAPPKS